MKKFLCVLTALMFVIGAGAANDETLTVSYDNIGEYVKAANPDIEQLKINIQGMERALGFLESTYSAEQNIARENLKESLEYTRHSRDAVRELLVYNAQLMISGTYQMDYQIEEIEDSVEALKSKLSVLDVMLGIGYTSKSQIDLMKLNIEILENTKNTLIRQKELLIKQLNQLMGRAPDLPLVISEFTLAPAQNINGGTLAEEDYETEFQIAYDNNHTLKTEKAKYDLLYKRDRFSTEFRAQRIALEKARSEFKTNFRSAFDDVFYYKTQIQIAQNQYDNKKADFDLTELKYKVGVVSKNDFTDAQNALKSEQRKIKLAEIDFMNAILKYKAYLNGAYPVSR